MSRSRRLIALTTLGVLLSLGTSGCSVDEWSRIGFPEPKTEQAPTILSLWQGFWIVALVVGVLTWGLIIWAVVAFRRKDGDPMPEQLRYNLPIEVLYTVAPAIVVAVLFLFTARDQAELTKLTDNPAQTVNVVGFRWSWAFNYVNNDAYDVGTPGEIPVLWLPVDERVRFELTSPDVIHSFWVPNFLFKMDIIPGRKNQFELTPNATGTYVGKCAELCGVDHARMLFKVNVVTKEQFAAHIAELKAKGQSGSLKDGRISTKVTDQGVK